MPAYDASGFSPPAPVVPVRLYGPTGLTRDNVPLLIDTGADVTVLPLAAAHALGVEAEPSQVVLQFFSGEEAMYLYARLTIEFSGYRFQGRFFLADVEYGVLGRNILNRLLLNLDGPRLNWSLS